MGQGRIRIQRGATVKREGKIILNYTEEPGLDQTAFYDKILELEQYLNNEVALECYRKFGIGVRFHV